MSYSKVNGNLVHMQSWEVTLKSEGLSVKGSVSAYPVSSVIEKNTQVLFRLQIFMVLFMKPQAFHNAHGHPL